MDDVDNSSLDSWLDGSIDDSGICNDSFNVSWLSSESDSENQNQVRLYLLFSVMKFKLFQFSNVEERDKLLMHILSIQVRCHISK